MWIEDSTNTAVSAVSLAWIEDFVGRVQRLPIEQQRVMRAIVIRYICRERSRLEQTREPTPERLVV